MFRARPKLCLFLGRHAGPSSGLWVYGRTVLEALLEAADPLLFPLEVAFAGPPVCEQELQLVLKRKNAGEQVQLRPLGKRIFGRRLALSIDAFTYFTRAPLVHGTANVVPVVGRARKIITLHDLLQALPFSSSLYTRLRAAYYRRYFSRAAGAAHLIITDADGTAERIRELFPSAAGKTLVVPCSLAAVYTQQPLPAERNASERFVAFASVDQRKNLPLLLRAFRSFLQQHGPRFSLCVIVSSAGLVSRVQRLAAENGLEQAVQTATGLEPEELAACYRGARGLLFPSLAEGFGYPVYEALSQGTPALAHQGVIGSALKRIAGEWLVEADCRSETAVTAAIQRLVLIEQPAEKREKIAQGVRAEFSLKKFGAALTAAYRGVL